MKTSKEEATAFFNIFYRGEHHIPNGGIRRYGEGWYVRHTGDLSTFDFDDLTRLVFLAHDMCFRVSIIPGRGLSKIAVWVRGSRKGKMNERHPTIRDALNEWRNSPSGHIS